MSEIKVFSLTPQPLHNEENIKSDPLRKACEELIDEFIAFFEQKDKIKNLKQKIETLCLEKGLGGKKAAKILAKLCQKRAEGIFKVEGDQAQLTLFEIQEEAEKANALFKYLPPFERLDG